MPGPYAAGGLGRLRVRHATAGKTPGANTGSKHLASRPADPDILPRFRNTFRTTLER